MTSRITHNRALIEALQNAHLKSSIEFKLFSDDWLIKLDKDDQTRFIFGYAFDINSQASAVIAADKVACYLLLADGKLAAVPHYLLSTVVKPEIDRDYLETLFKANSSLVLKPTDGSRGDLVIKVGDPDELLKHTVMNTRIDSWTVSPHIEIKKEIRLVVLNGVVQLAYEKFDPPSINGLKMFNLNLGASVVGINIKNISEDVTALARDAIKSIGLTLGAVDVVFDADNAPSILEINSGFSLEHFALNSEANRAEVVAFYELVISQLF